MQGVGKGGSCISVDSGSYKICDSVFGPRWNLLTDWEIYSLDRIGATTLRRSYGSNGEIVCQRNIGAHSRTM